MRHLDAIIRHGNKLHKIRTFEHMNMPQFFFGNFSIENSHPMNLCLLITLSVIIRLYVINNPYSIYVCHI